MEGWETLEETGLLGEARVMGLEVEHSSIPYTCQEVGAVGEAGGMGGRIRMFLWARMEATWRA